MRYLGRYLETPVGELMLVEDADRNLVRIDFPGSGSPEQVGEEFRAGGGSFEMDPQAAGDAARQLTEYFDKRRKTFELPLAPCGTDFQREVWNALLAIPYGACCTYSDIAGRLGKPKAVRAVGLANGRNPIPIVIPCHRVIGANGHLTGYGGGIETKAFLLRHEGYLMV